MWFVKNPEWFDVIVTDNMFGDIITDLGAMIQGGMGIAAGGNINPGGTSMFEPIGGSAPKYTGQGVINPLAAICAGQMMLDFLGEPKAAQAVETAVIKIMRDENQKPRRRQDGPQHFAGGRPGGGGGLMARMKSLTEHLWFETPHRRDYINITDTVEELVSKSGVKEGICLVNAMHITASVFINDAEDGLLHDYDVWLEKLAPHEPTSQYQHNRTGEDNADAHLKRQVMGREVVVAITKGELDLGPWEQIFYGEFDGRRRKRVLVKIIGE